MILLLPIGALIVVIMRLLVGLRTSGTFMPILIALALIQTTLLTGIIIFLTVVGTGLLIRILLVTPQLIICRAHFSRDHRGDCNHGRH